MSGFKIGIYRNAETRVPEGSSMLNTGSGVSDMRKFLKQVDALTIYKLTNVVKASFEL